MSALRQVTDSTSSYDLAPAQESKDSESLQLQTIVKEQQTALETMDHLFDALSEPNRAMQDELAKMNSAFQRFMEKAESRLDALSEENKGLKEELAKEKAFSAEVLKANEALSKKVDQLGTEMRAGFAAQNSAQGQTNTAMWNKINKVEECHVRHTHAYNFQFSSGGWCDWTTKGPNI